MNASPSRSIPKPSFLRYQSPAGPIGTKLENANGDNLRLFKASLPISWHIQCHALAISSGYLRISLHTLAYLRNISAISWHILAFVWHFLWQNVSAIFWAYLAYLGIPWRFWAYLCISWWQYLAYLANALSYCILAYFGNVLISLHLLKTFFRTLRHTWHPVLCCGTLAADVEVSDDSGWSQLACIRNCLALCARGSDHPQASPQRSF